MMIHTIVRTPPGDKSKQQVLMAGNIYDSLEDNNVRKQCNTRAVNSC